jgi:hypothetical protein
MELFKGNLQDLLAPASPLGAGSIRKLPHEPVPSKPLASPLQLPKRIHRRRCSCGKCPQCLENARWEKVFTEKFADPLYYNRDSLRYSSPLSEASRLG